MSACVSHSREVGDVARFSRKCSESHQGPREHENCQDQPEIWHRGS